MGLGALRSSLPGAFGGASATAPQSWTSMGPSLTWRKLLLRPCAMLSSEQRASAPLLMRPIDGDGQSTRAASGCGQCALLWVAFLLRPRRCSGERGLAVTGRVPGSRIARLPPHLSAIDAGPGVTMPITAFGSVRAIATNGPSPLPHKCVQKLHGSAEMTGSTLEDWRLIGGRPSPDLGLITTKCTLGQTWRFCTGPLL